MVLNLILAIFNFKSDVKMLALYIILVVASMVLLLKSKGE